MTHKTFSFRIPLGVYEQLEREALARKVSVAEVILECVELRQIAAKICQFNQEATP